MSWSRFCGTGGSWKCNPNLPHRTCPPTPQLKCLCPRLSSLHAPSFLLIQAPTFRLCPPLLISPCVAFSNLPFISQADAILSVRGRCKRERNREVTHQTLKRHVRRAWAFVDMSPPSQCQINYARMFGNACPRPPHAAQMKKRASVLVPKGGVGASNNEQA